MDQLNSNEEAKDDKSLNANEDDDDNEDEEEDEDDDEYDEEEDMFDADDEEFNDIIHEQGALVGEKFLTAEFEANENEAKEQQA